MTRMFIGILFTLALCLSSQAQTTQTKTTITKAPAVTETVYSRTLKSTALIVCGKMQGTCWVLSKSKKLVVTNEHVIHDGGEILVCFPVMKEGRVLSNRDEFLKQAKPIKGKLIKAEELRDLAIVQLESIPDTAIDMKIASSVPNPGDEVHAIGCPGGSQGLFVYSYGRVRQVTDSVWDVGTVRHAATVIETQLPINPGDSGGPLVNNRAELVGINQGGNVKAQLMSYSIAVAELRKFAAEKTTTVAKPNTPSVAPAVKSLYVQADTAIRNKQWESARDLLVQWVKSNPKHLPGLLDLAYVHNELKEYHQAILVSASAIDLNRSNATAWREMGFAALMIGKLPEAANALVESAKLDANVPATFTYLSMVLEKQGKTQLAAQAKKKAEDLMKVAKK